MDNLKGINTDVNPRNQIPGSYRFALNAVNNSKQGDMRSLSNEQGNLADVDIPEDFLPIGSCYLRPNESIIMSAGGDDDEYVRIDKRVNRMLVNLFYIRNSGWTSAHQVKIETKVINGCEDILIITDGVNPIRYINISERDEYLLDGETIDTANADGEGWNLGQMNINPSFTVPTVSAEVLDTGGTLDLGTYIIVPQYLTEGLDATSWLQHVGVIPIYDEAFYGEYVSIDGGFTLETTKSIRVDFSNLDTSFSFLRIAVVQNIDGVVTAVIIATLPITSSDLTYVITGNEVGTTIDLAELTSENGIYEAAEDIKLYDNRLWLLNVKERQLNHAVLQEAAFNIEARWFSKYVQAEFTGSEDSKSATYYLDHRSYMRDETYAFGIRFKFRGSWYSPVYPLAGRPKDIGFFSSLPTASEPNPWHNRLAPTTGWDSTLYEVGVDIPLADVEHLGFVTGAEDIGDGPGLVQRWRVFNTATYDAGLITGDHLAAGEFAYVESTDTYPNNSVYGANAGLPIRDFKFPDAILHDIGRGVKGGTTANAFSGDLIASGYAVFPMGVKFSNIDIPEEYEDEIEGYEIVRIERTNSNSSVLDKGILHRVVHSESTGGTTESYLQQTFPANWVDEVTADGYNRHVNEFYQTFHSPVAKFTGFIGGSYLKIDGEQWGNVLSYPGFSSFYRSMLVPIGFGYDTFPSFTEPVYNRKVNDKAFAGADTPPSGGLTVDIDNTEQQEALYLELNSNLPYTKSTDMFPTPLDPSYFLYAAIKENLTNQYGQVEGRIYIPTDSTLHEDDTCEVFGGDTFISPLTFRRCSRWDENYAPINHSDEGDVSTYEGKELFKFYTESKINSNLRNEGVDATQVYYPKSSYTSIMDFIYQEAAADTDLIPNYYAYNSVFSWENNVKAFFGIPFGFNYDSDCLGEFPTRIVCSEKDNVESSSDSNKIFLPNNYRDLPKTKGSGLSLFIKEDKLFAHMERTLFNIPVKDVTTKIGDVNAYFGTGEVLSIPPQEVVTAEKGQVGLSSKWSHVETPYGVVFVSHEDKKVYLFSNSLEPISSLGLSTWSNEHMKFHLIDDFIDLMNESESEEQFTRFRNNASPYGIGFHSTYDPVNDRVIITKRDYRVKFTPIRDGGDFNGIYDSEQTYDEGNIVFDTSTGTFGIIEFGEGLFGGTTQSFKPLNYYDRDYFEDCSWTLSWSFLSKSWVSFHSYIPLFYMFDKDVFYSYFWDMTKTVLVGLGEHPHIFYDQTTLSENLYAHSKDANFQRYYTVLKPHIIDIIIPSQAPSNFTNIFLDAKLSNLDATYEEWHDINYIPFTDVVGYNTDQCTGNHEIVVVNGYNAVQDWASNKSYARRIGNLWRIDNLRNLVVDNTLPLFTSAWDDISDSYYIDKIVNENALDYNLSQYRMGRMNDLWIGLRLTSSFEDRELDDYTTGEMKVTTNIINTINYQSR